MVNGLFKLMLSPNRYDDDLLTVDHKIYDIVFKNSNKMGISFRYITFELFRTNYINKMNNIFRW